jgi:type IV pilus assembly protein PilA
MHRRGFTLIEVLVVVVIIGILAAIAIPKAANTKSKAVLAAMKSDLRNLATAQEGFFFDNSDYAGSTNILVQVNGTGGAGSVYFRATTGNVLVLTYGGKNGWSATVTNPALVIAPATCGIYVGPAAYAPNPAVTVEGAPMCW